MRLHCFLLSVAWFQLALISSDCFESFFQSFKYGSIVCPGRLPAEVPWKRQIAKSCDHPQWRSGYVRSGLIEGTEFKSC